MEENTEQRIDLTLFSEKIQGLKERIASVIVGQEQTVDLVLTAILANGHVLIEGVPGVAKTLLARLTARLIDADFSRIQFTPDLMPSDVLGTTVFNMKTNEFDFHKGPIFADIVLVEADGSKHMPIKFPAAHEPVIPENVNEIQVVMGLHAIGHPFCEVSHRLELVKQCLNVSDTDLVTEVHLKKLYLEGYQKPLQKKYPKAKIGFFPADHSNYFDN